MSGKKSQTNIQSFFATKRKNEIEGENIEDNNAVKRKQCPVSTASSTSKSIATTTTAATTTTTVNTKGATACTSSSSTINVNLNIEAEVQIEESDDTQSAPSDISKIGENQKEQKITNISFPRTKNRCFQESWIDKFTWIEYSVKRDAIFCYNCRQFPTSSTTNNPDDKFTVSGFRNWSAALQKDKGFQLHERSAYHISATASMQEKILRESKKKEVSQLACGDVLSLRRYYVRSILDVVTFLASNELAMRGNWDIDAKAEDGLFQNLFDYTLKKDELLQKAVKLIPKNATYTSPEIQNDLIRSAVFCTRQSIVKKVNSSEYFTLYVDGTKDKNGVECISIAARYVLDGKPHESVLGMERCDDLSAIGIADVILKSLEKYGINTDKLLSQCYDGAFVMSGHKGGVQTIIQEKLKRRIPYVHCFSHRLHLVIIDVIKLIDLAKVYFDQLNMIYKFFKLYKVKKVYEGKVLHRLITTRWEGHLKSTKAICESYVELVKCLNEIGEKGVSFGLDGDDIAMATGIHACITKRQFIYTMFFMKEILEIIKPADKILQSREIGYVDAVPVIKAVLNALEGLRKDEEFEKFDQKAEELIAHISDTNTQPRRVHTRSSSIEIRQNHIRPSYFEILDTIISEIKSRFEENDSILITLCNAREMELSSFKPLADLNRIDLPSERELQIAKLYLKEQDEKQKENENDENERNDDVDPDDKKVEKQNILQRLYPVRAAFGKVYKLFCAIETFACSTAISECSFSCLARVGILGRVHMSNERLRNLSFLAFESKEFTRIDAEEILRHFNENKARRLQIY